MVNKIHLIGNLGKKPETRKLDNGVQVAKFSLATNENYKDKNGEGANTRNYFTKLILTL